MAGAWLRIEEVLFVGLRVPEAGPKLVHSKDLFVKLESELLALFPEGGGQRRISTIEHRNGPFVLLL